ncbi:rhodanese-like domain-containing protein [Streptomyces griseofuscus]|uniref:rhodanese-like domain-containing protein n=1 Tax=Streptomyces griseofuscus TaxID=146922 RepID=UPI00369774D1
MRNCVEREGGRSIEGAPHIPLAELAERPDEVPAEGRLVVHCASGHRSSIAASLLRHGGRSEVYDLLRGYAARESAA